MQHLWKDKVVFTHLFTPSILRHFSWLLSLHLHLILIYTQRFNISGHNQDISRLHKYQSIQFSKCNTSFSWNCKVVFYGICLKIVICVHMPVASFLNIVFCSFECISFSLNTECKQKLFQNFISIATKPKLSFMHSRYIKILLAVNWWKMPFKLKPS